MLKKSSLTLALLVFPAIASAEWVAGLGFAQMSPDDRYIDFKVNSVVGSLAYQRPGDEGFSWVPEFRVGVGAGDDTVDFGPADPSIELDHYYGGAVRAQYATDSGIYLYAAPSVTKMKFSISEGSSGVDVTSDWDLGLGGGLGYRIVETLSAEFGYERRGRIDILTLQARFHF